MSLQSKFKAWIIIPVGLLLIAAGVIAAVDVLFIKNSETPSLLIIFLIVLFVFIWIWVFFGELRTKVIKVKIDEEQVIV